MSGRHARDEGASKPGPHAPSDAALVVAARAGERWAQEALFLRHVRMVGGMVFRLLPSRNDLDDIVQDTFVAAFESLGKLQNPQAFGAWIGSIAIRITHKRLRRKRIAARIGLGSPEAIEWEDVVSPIAPPDVVAELKEIYEVVATLPSKERIAFVLRKVEGMSLEEVAEATQSSLATVKRRIAAADLKLVAARNKIRTP
jgi:RNA polymerase sigma-70 factor (ECF subfamily)